ncbi:zinc finger and BTB domain-containing protein 17-like [Topomyia yanbarensis]|uniref:zinc finger and BTB domain-containing protein 17-like n=1 Tax=Topomyia yanbarensis TaxID=2498891 RepID=UPI00273ACAAD|nr:zinc finger and BTB domain-containing protein 17-like [Topomyia yanbarensis]
MLMCRACGQSFFDKDHCESLEKYVDTYFNLTTIQIRDYEDPSQSKVCGRCVLKLNEFSQFRKLCLQVHWRLHKIKVEKSDEENQGDTLTVEVECKPELPDPIESILENEASVSVDDNDNSGGEDNSDENEDCDDDGGTDNSDDKDYEEENITANKDKDSGLPKARKRKEGPSKPKKQQTKYGPLKKKESKEQRTVFPCDQCPRKFFVLFRFNAHKRTHDGLKPFECEICRRAFNTANSLKLHRIQQHSNNRIYMYCDHSGCGQRFADQRGLKKHQNRVHNPDYVMPAQIALICDICGKSFTTNGGLQRHKYTHTPGEMPFVCKICSKQFSTSNKLKIHTMRHEGVKNHTCPQCGLRKTTMHELKTHIRHMHSTEPRSYSCETCARQFSNPASLGLHNKTVHLGLKPYICTVCQFAFGRSDHLKRHMQGHMRAGLL